MKPAINAFTTTFSTQPHQLQQQQQQQQHRTVSVEPQFKAHMTATDVSFSSYITAKEPDDKRASSAAADDSELSIFDARKYFNEGGQLDQVLGSSKRVSPIREFNTPSLCDPSSFPRFSSASSVDGYATGYRTRSLASSEASWNSQSGLLSSSARGGNSGGQTGGKRGCRIIPRWLVFRPHCPCSGKRSVRVKERPAENHSAPKEAVTPKAPPAEVPAVKVNVIADPHERFLKSIRGLRPTQEDHFTPETGGRHLLISAPPKPLLDSNIGSSNNTGFTFPILPPPSMPSISSPPPKMPWNGSRMSSPSRTDTLPISALPNNLPRNSLDVFKSHHQLLNFPPPSLRPVTSPGRDECDELGSDASSDLFEIESISTQATYPMTHQRRRDSLDEAKLPASSQKDHQTEAPEEYSVSSPEFERSPKV